MQGVILGVFSGFISGLAIIVIGIISVRVSCELIILLFNIYAKLKEIAENTKINHNMY
ncbi:DUF4282 domain-containing protein [Arsenophonus endosymbiont of Apis mellifera]|uniref:DUF4282 domain-containing protein n=1 Tax=Arsenophonus endosymbiont of Apis mellifera TaxID=1541805 RepID=UPI00351ABE24